MERGFFFLKKIGLLGGSFNPIHFGHLNAAKEALSSGKIDEVWFVPALQNPLKEKKPAPAKHRINMIKLAIAGNKKFKVKDFEIRHRIKYTVDSLNFLEKNFPHYEFFLIMGKPLLKELHRWKKFEKVLEQIEIIPVELKIHVSSSIVRKKISKGKSVSKLVPEKVEKYILENRLYSD